MVSALHGEGNIAQGLLVPGSPPDEIGEPLDDEFLTWSVGDFMSILYPCFHLLIILMVSYQLQLKVFFTVFQIYN